MEILSDATFKGNVSISGGNFSIKSKGVSGSELVVSDITLLSTNISGSSVFVYGGFYVNPLNDNKESGLTITKGQHGTTYIQFKGTEFFEGQTYFNSGFTVADETHVRIPRSIYVGSSDSGGSITFPSKAGTLALTSDIPSLSGYLTSSSASSTYLSKTDASSTYQKKFTTFSSPSIPANCTAFEFTGTAISDSNKTHLIQVQNTSTGKSVIAETWMTTNKKPAMSFAGCTSTVAAGTYTAIVL